MTAERPRRSLMLAGGGMKVAFQAGVLQVWLDEAGIKFDHVDACSGGAFNLAMFCQGFTGLEIADTWRRTDPRDGISVSLTEIARFPFGRSLVDLDDYRRYVFPRWGLDRDLVRQSPVTATFSAYDITRRRLRTFSAREFDIDVLCACISLPVWFPPVKLADGPYTDAVFVTDANIQAALKAGADEIWIIWTVSTRAEWLPGPVAQFFHALESAANSHLQQDLDRIQANNAIIEAGGTGPLGRYVKVRCLRAEVPLHYLVVLGRDRLHRAVERGVAEARRWCDAEGVGFEPIRSAVRYDDGIGIVFRDHLRGRLVASASDDLDVVDLDADLHLIVDDVGRFATDPRHPARLRGVVRSTLFAGGSAKVVDGTAHVLVDDGCDPTRKQFRYHVLLRDGACAAFTLVGVKYVESGRISCLWRETTTLYSRLLEGHTPEAGGGEHPLVASGPLTMSPLDVLRQVFGANPDGPRFLGRVAGLARFGTAFAGNLWDVYARGISSYGPF